MKNKLFSLLGFLYATLIVSKEKAVVAFVVATVASLALKHGLTLDVSAQTALTSLLVGVIAHVSVYFTRNT
jgi:hypothetical protein